IRFAASKAGATELGSTSVIALSETVLRTMVSSRLKLVMHVALGVGIAAALGWPFWHGKRNVPSATEARLLRPAVLPVTPIGAGLSDQGMVGPEEPARVPESEVAVAMGGAATYGHSALGWINLAVLTRSDKFGLNAQDKDGVDPNWPPAAR